MRLLAGLVVIYALVWALILIQPQPPDHSPTGLEWLNDPEEPLFHNGRPTERIPLNELPTAAQPEELPLGYRYADTSPVDETENEDIEDPPLTWAEAHCAPKSYRPPEALVPDPFHPANVLSPFRP